MTGRTTSLRDATHGLTVLDGGLADAPRFMLDEHDAHLGAAWLAQEMAEAARLCDQLEAEGTRIAFEPRGNGERGVQVSIRDLIHDQLVRDLDARDVLDMDRLAQLNGMSA
ncbi:MAG: hypothetical protein JHD16_18360 [Solirubrobacteraceae bacterium]|nr:hypothetical protein [Solirubrobacteraceae bacterium]